MTRIDGPLSENANRRVLEALAARPRPYGDALSADQVVCREDDLFKQWEALGGPLIYRDGAINAAQYAAAPYKVLVALKEGHGTPEHAGINLARGFLAGESTPATFNNVARWACGILGNLRPFADVCAIELKDGPKFRPAWLGRIAVINVNKEGGKASCDHARLQRLGAQFAPLLRSQVEEILKPDLVICGGALVSDIMQEACPGLAGGTWRPVRAGRATASANVDRAQGPVLVSVPHPQSRYATAAKYDALAAALTAAVEDAPGG